MTFAKQSIAAVFFVLLCATSHAAGGSRNRWSVARNIAPVISGTPGTSGKVGVTYSFTPTASDANGNTLGFSVTNKPSWAAFNTSTGQLSGVPGSAAIGTYANIIIGVSDGYATTSLAPFSIAVTSGSVSGSSSSSSSSASSSSSQIAVPAAAWSRGAWSAAHQSPENLSTIWDKTWSFDATNGVTYYARMNAWNSAASGFRYQNTWANNEHDWGVTTTHVNDGQVKSYSSVVRGWTIGEGVQPMTKPIGIQIPNLKKVHVRWAFDAPSDYGGQVGAAATNRVNVLWDTYFHTVANPAPNEMAHTNLMINQYVVDGDGWFGDLAMRGQSVVLGGKQWQMYVLQGPAATGNTIELFPGPLNDYKVMGTKDLTFDYLGVVKDLVAMGLIPSTDYLTSIQAGYEAIAGGSFKTTQFWTAINNEADGSATTTTTSTSTPTPTPPTPTSTATATSVTSSVGACGGTSANVSWVYHNGAMSPNWPYDYSWGGLVADYKDTSGTPLNSPYDIKVTAPIYAGWQPASLNWSFDVTGCKYLTFALKPTVANQQWSGAFLYVGDIGTGIMIYVTSNAAYGPVKPAVGQWNVYKVPLSVFFPNGVVPSSIYKFQIQDQSGNGGANNVWYIDNVGFLGS